jgi:hypothetical protein
VKEPYASVRTEGKAPLSILGADVYLQEGNHAQQEGRRSRRSH